MATYEKQLAAKQYDTSDFKAGSFIKYIRLPDPDNPGQLRIEVQVLMRDENGEEEYGSYVIDNIHAGSKSTILQQLKAAAEYMLADHGYTVV